MQSEAITKTNVECLRNCNATDGLIIGHETDNIALKYNVNTKNFTMLLVEYNEILIITLMQNGKLILNSAQSPKFINFSETKPQKTIDGYYFTFEIMKLNRNMQLDEIRSSITLTDVTAEWDSNLLDILFGPELLSKWVSKYEVLESGSIPVVLTGNPKPELKAHIEHTHLNVTSNIDANRSSVFQYDIHLEGMTRDFCGKLLQMFAF